MARTLGIARAIIEMTTDRFVRSSKAIQKESRQMAKAVDDVGDATDKATKRSSTGLKRHSDAAGRAAGASGRFVKSLDDKQVSRFGSKLEGLVGVMTRMSVVASGITIFGLKEANDMKKVEAQVKVFTDSARDAQRVMDDMRDMSKRFGTPYQDLLKGAAAFLPAAKQNNVEVDKLVRGAMQIQALSGGNASFDQAKFSLTELLSGDTVSARDIGNLSKDEAAYLKEAAGDAEELLRRMDEIAAKRGITDQTLIDLGTDGSTAFQRLTGATRELVGKAMTPLWEALIPLVEKLTEFVNKLNEGNSPILGIAGALTSAVAAGGPLIGVFGMLLKQAKKLGPLMSKLSIGGIGKAGVAGGLVAAIPSITETVARGLADRGIGDQRLRSDGGMDFGEWVKEKLGQVWVLLVDLAIKAGKEIDFFLARLGRIPSMFGSILELMRTAVEGLGANLNNWIGGLMVGIADLIPDWLFDTSGIRAAGEDLQEQAKLTIDGGEDADGNKILSLEERQTAALENLQQGFALDPETAASKNAYWNETYNREVGNAVDFVTGAGDAKAALDEFGTEIGEFTDDTAAAVAKIQSGDVEFSDDQVEAFREFQEDVVAIEERAADQRENVIQDSEMRIFQMTQQYESQRTETIEAHEEARAEAIEDAAEQTTEMVARHQEQRSKLIANAARQEQRDREKLDKDIAKLIQDGVEAEAEARINAQERINDLTTQAQEAEIKEIDRHEKALADIRKKRRLELLDASRTLDAQAALDAHRRAEEETAQENQEHDTKMGELRTRLQEETAAIREETAKQIAEQQAARQARIAEMRAELEERHRLQREDNALRLAEMDEQHAREMAKNEANLQERLAKMDEEHAEALAKMDEQHAEEMGREAAARMQRLHQIEQQTQAELAKREQAFQREFNALATHEAQKFAIEQKSMAQSEKELLAYWNRRREIEKKAAAPKESASSLGDALGNASKNKASSAGSKLGDMFKKSLGVFHVGKERVRKTGPYTLEEGEMVLPTRAADPIRRLLGANPITKLLQMVERTTHHSEYADLIASGREGRQLAIAAQSLGGSNIDSMAAIRTGGGNVNNHRAISVNAPVTNHLDGTREARIAQMIQERFPAMIEAWMHELLDEVT